ncbi:MAG: hypothetical protein IJ514_01525 [Clostridia bacterium]|nr:hypothetical protein [Clostridia bacterium]
MEQKTVKNEISTKENEGLKRSVVLSHKDAEEYRSYKRRKKLNEITAAISASGASLFTGQEVQRVCERAIRFKQAAVKLPITKLSQAAYYLTGSKVKIDCVVGGSGETLAKVKAYEARIAVKRGAKEITAIVTPSLLDCCRYGEIRKEMKRLRRAAGKASLKVRVESVLAFAVLSRVARIACEVGAQYFSVPYFLGCERLKTDMTRGCGLEVTGVNETEDFKRLVEFGAARVVTDRAPEIYAEWLKSAEEETTRLFEEKEERAEEKKEPPVATLARPSVQEETPQTVGPIASPVGDPETEYCCRLEGTELKFL